MSPAMSAPSGSTSVPALRRAVAILDYLSDTSGDITMTDLVRVLNIPKSTAHGLIIAMEEMGLIKRTSAGVLRIGVHPLSWASGFLAQTSFSSCFNEYFSMHRELAKYTVTMTVLEGAEVVYIACAQTNQPLGVTFRTGMRLPAAFTATGKALLASLSNDELTQRFAGHFPPPLTPHSVCSLKDLKTELAAMRATGISIDNGQVREGMICLGAVVRDHTGASVAGIALSLTRSEASDEAITHIGAQLRAAADTISRQLGWKPTGS